MSRQLIGSLLVAALIVVVTIFVVNARFGPTSAADRELQEERLEQQEEQREDAEDRREDR